MAMLVSANQRQIEINKILIEFFPVALAGIILTYDDSDVFVICQPFFQNLIPLFWESHRTTLSKERVNDFTSEVKMFLQTLKLEEKVHVKPLPPKLIPMERPFPIQLEIIQRIVALKISSYILNQIQADQDVLESVNQSLAYAIEYNKKSTSNLLHKEQVTLSPLPKGEKYIFNEENLAKLSCVKGFVRVFM